MIHLELALQYASMSLRGDGQWMIGQSLGPIGWRVRKHYFKVVPKQTTTKHSPGHSTQKHHLTKSGSQTQSQKAHAITSPSSSFEKDVKESPKEEYILGWTEYGPDRYIDEREVHAVLKSLTGIHHPYIYPLDYIASGDNGALMIRRFNKTGTLKDLLCGCAPINPFLTKYGSPKGRSPIPLKDLALYGRQIIEALKYLHTRGLAHGHVHAGNVVIIDGNVRLLEIENFFLGVPSFYRPFFIQHSRINTLESIDVYAFGHLLHELALGYPLQESCTRQITSDCPESLKNLLESILLKESLKGNLPTLDQLAEHKFFKEHVPSFNQLNEEILNANKPQFKLQPNVKEFIRIHVQKCETRLRDEQKSVKNQKRLVRVQELMTSEEKEKKQKQKQKNEQKQAKLRAQNSLQLHNGPPPVTPVMIKSDSVSSISSSTQFKHQMTSLTPPPIPTSSRHEFTIPPLPSTSSNVKPLGNGSNGNKVDDEGEERKTPEVDSQRTALLESICNFKRGELRKINSN